MLKLSGGGEKDGKPVKIVMLGLSHVNLDRLKKGQPIKFDGAEVSLPGVEMIIFAGKDERSMQRELADLIGPGTITNIDPRFRD